MSARARILIIEDDPAIVDLVRAILEDDYIISSAFNGLEGLRQLIRDRPDLVILDLGLSELDGRELLHQIRSDPVLGSTPVIITSAYTNLRELVPDGHAQVRLAKPFSVDGLVDAVEAVLRRAGKL